ncbi:ATP-binding protein [Natrinema sp. 74]|uniref:ATP-binding protein n=1 Tax=Natrinema sp. 74 TaxID=3384159 RepID=UPI0038D40077
MTEPRRYIRIEPARERVDSADIVSRLAGLRKLRTGWKVKYDPRKSPPTFEFLALTRGEDAPVRFYLGVDDKELLPTVKSELQTAYPASYEIYEETVDLPAELCRPTKDEEPQPPTEGGDTEEQEGSLSEHTPIAARWSGVGERSRDWMTPIKQYSQVQEEGTSSGDPARAPLATAVERLTEATAPTALQVLFMRYGSWQKFAESRKKQIETKHDGALQSARTSLADMLHGADEERIRDRRRGRDPPHVGESTQQTSSAASGEVASRQALIDQKGPSQTFLVNARTVAVLSNEPDEAVKAQAANNIETLANAFNHLDGYFYHLDGSRVTKSLTNIRDPATKELKRLVSRSFNQSSMGKRRPQLILNADELANFVAVPSAQSLTTEGSRGARGKERLRQPLPLPDPDLLEEFAGSGMTVGKPLRNRNEPLDQPIRIPPDLLTTSYIRAASTGSGKSTAVQAEMLSLHEYVDGPTVLLDGKGDGMAENYLHAHYAENGNLDDVYYFNAPDTLPAVSFFDIRPALAMGRSREDAVQDKVEHFHEIMRLILGEERHEQAYVANEILTFLIKALFDREYGHDAFSLEDLIQAVFRMSQEKTLPELCDANSHIEQSLVQKCQVDDRQFQQTMGAAANRLDKLVEHEHLYQMFTHVPEWDDEEEEYVGNAFDFREFVDEDAVILFDLGEFRAESQHALTMILLSNLWDAVQGRRGGGRSLNGGSRQSESDADDTIVNMIIEEAAPVATSSLVYEQFIPQGRAFGVSLGLILQYPEQVAQYSTSDRPYTEILNNVKTKLIGNIATDAKLAESMAHENLSTSELRNRVSRLPAGEWIAQLPSPQFGQTGPAPFSLASLPIPEGHPESDAPLSGDDRHLFEEQQIPQVMRRTQHECSLPGRTNQFAREEVRETLDEVGDDVDGEPATTSGSTAGAGAADGGTSSDAPFFGADGTSDDADASAEDETAITAGQPTTPSGDERDIGSAPMFGATASEQQESEGSPQLSAAGQAASEHREERNEASELQTTNGDEDTEDSAETTGGDLLPEHVSYDANTECYVCDVCRSEYTASEERKASACCQFASKDDVFVAAKRARSTASSSSELFTRLGTITEHAESYGIEVTIQDFANLEGSSEESAAAPNGESEEPAEPEESQNPNVSHSIRFKDATTTIPDETLREEGITRDEAAFLGLVLDAMNHQVEEYSLLESMTVLKEPFSNLDLETLKEKEFIEEHRSFWQTYYTVLPAGRRFLDRSLDTSPGIGDLGEKTPHKAAVVFLEAWLSQQKDVARTAVYYQHSEDVVFDVAGFDAADELVWVGEVETPSNNTDALLSDYEKLATVDAAAVWACEDKDLILEIIESLTGTDTVDISLTSTQTRTISSLRAAINDHDLSGMGALHTFRSLKTEVDHEP